MIKKHGLELKPSLGTVKWITDWNLSSNYNGNCVVVPIVNYHNIICPNILNYREYSIFLHESSHRLNGDDNSKAYFDPPFNTQLTPIGWIYEKSAWKEAKSIAKWWVPQMTRFCKEALVSYQKGKAKRLNISDKEIEDFINDNFG